MRNHHTGSRPHVQGASQPLRVRHSARHLTDGGGLVVVRKLFDRFGLAGWIDVRAKKEKGFFRPGLMTEVWIALLLYGGGVIDDLPLLDRRGVRRIFGWIRVPDPTTFGRWLRRASGRMVPLLDELLWRMVRQRWALLPGGAPKKLTLMLDSTVVVRYGHKQAGAEVGYNPKKRGPSLSPPDRGVHQGDRGLSRGALAAGPCPHGRGSCAVARRAGGTAERRGRRRDHGAPRQRLLQQGDDRDPPGAGRLFSSLKCPATTG